MLEEDVGEKRRKMKRGWGLYTRRSLSMNNRPRSDGRPGFVWSGFTFLSSLLSRDVIPAAFTCLCVIFRGSVNGGSSPRLAFCLRSHSLHFIFNEAQATGSRFSCKGQMTVPAAFIASKSLSTYIQSSRNQLLILSRTPPPVSPAIISNASSSTRIPTHSSICLAPMPL